MASFAKRKQLVNELRKAHFHLGFESNADAESEYIHKYKEYQVKMERENKDSRAHHYELGNDVQTNYLSQFKERYPGYQNSEQNALSQQKKNDLRRQHFNLGFDNNPAQSTYAGDYDKKQATHQNQADKQEKINGLRKHNHDFGDSLTYFSSTYNEQHNKNMTNYHMQPKQPIDGNMLRKTNMILGHQPVSYTSQSADTFTKKQNAGTRAVGKMPTNVDLGSDPNQFQSTHKQAFDHKDSAAIPVDKNRIRDFRSAHFALGNAPNTYTSEHRGEFNEKPIQPNEPISKPPTNVELSHGNDEPNMSIYKDCYQGVPGQAAQPCKRAGELQSVVLGSDPDQYVSEGKAKFVAHPLADNRLSDDKKKVLSGASLELGKDVGDYSTQHRDTYVNRFLELKRAGLSQEQLQELRKKHFQNGYYNRNDGTSNAEYGTRLGPANRLDPEVRKGMRRTNIYDNEPDRTKKTIYTSAYMWKENPAL